MAFEIKNRVTETKVDSTNTPVKHNYKIVLEKYDGREISSSLGCIAKDLYVPKINDLTLVHSTPDLYINDTVLS